MWFWQEWEINRAIQGSWFNRKHALWSLEEALKLHNQFVRSIWKPEETDVDEALREWDIWTMEVLDLVEDGQSRLITFDEGIAKMKSDAQVHQFYIDIYPNYDTRRYGNLEHQKKWRDRWLAVAKLLEQIKSI